MNNFYDYPKDFSYIALFGKDCRVSTSGVVLVYFNFNLLSVGYLVRLINYMSRRSIFKVNILVISMKNLFWYTDYSRYNILPPPPLLLIQK
jgi:hypothetical protein